MIFKQIFIKADGRDKYSAIETKITGKSSTSYNYTNGSTDGEDGADAVTYYMLPSCTSIHVDKLGIADPSVFSVKQYKQEGSNSAYLSDDCTIMWDYNVTSGPTKTYTAGTTITVDTTYDFISLFLIRNNKTIQTLTINMAKDGQDGEGKQGEQGLAGPVMRGPVEWSATTRRWCNGTENESYSDDAKYMDLCMYNGEYYICTTSYNGSNTDTWASVSSNWTKADGKYDFIATNVLLADNAKIKFQSSTGLYLVNSANTVTGGAQAATSTDSVVFWAGSSIPSSGNFQVDFNGNITAKSGTFAGYVQMPYTPITSLTIASGGYVADSRAYLVGDYMMPTGSTLYLPNPTEALNGFTYHIILQPRISTKSADQDATIYVQTSTAARNILVFAVAGCTETPDKVAFYGGHVEITCVPISGEYKWIVTQCTGGVDIYLGGTYICSFTPLNGYSRTSNEYAIAKVMAEPTLPSSKEADTLYITRS